MNTSIHHIVSCGLLAMLLLAMSGCQSISGFAPYCQSDDDCQSHQFCDTDENACFVREAYSTSCDPDLLFPDCPAATTCDETAKICIPRTFRAAFIYPFNTSVYGRRQYANMLRFLTESVSKQLFEPLDCKESSEDAQKAHIVYTCTGQDIEFLFINSGDDEEQTAQNISDAYKFAPFDITLPGRSIEYAYTVPFLEQNQANLFTLGRSNLNLDYVSKELEPDYKYPSLETRFDFSLKTFSLNPTYWSFVMEELECERPLTLSYNVGIENLTQHKQEELWAKHGTCLDRITLEDSSSVEWVDTITEKDIDCLLISGFVDANQIYDLLSTYTQSSRYTKSPRIKWLTHKYLVDESSAITQNLRDIILSSFREDMFFISGEISSSPKYNSFAAQLEKDYKTYLDKRSCLNTPQRGCDSLTCDAPSSPIEEDACAQLNCPSTPNCLELGCLVSDPPEWCNLIQCESTRNCDYYEPNQLYTISFDISSIITQISTSWLLFYKVRARQNASQMPMSREALRDSFLEIMGHKESDHSCIFPDLTSCELLSAQQKKYSYTNIFPMTINPDARISTNQNTTTLYSQVNSAFEFLPPTQSYSYQDAEELNNRPAVEPAPECN